jgi:hypothetical protein
MLLQNSSLTPEASGFEAFHVSQRSAITNSIILESSITAKMLT